jgi:hypothetical protein
MISSRKLRRIQYTIEEKKQHHREELCLAKTDMTYEAPPIHVGKDTSLSEPGFLELQRLGELEQH